MVNTFSLILDYSCCVCSHVKAFEAWIQSLPEKNSPSLLGLPATAENQLQSTLGLKCLHHLSYLQKDFDVDVIESEDGADSGKHASSRLKTMLDTAQLWMSSLPANASLLPGATEKASEAAATPMERCLAREIIKAAQVTALVRKDLSSIM
jgi:hypothetical protein